MNRKVFFDVVRKSLFGGSLKKGQVDGMTRTLDFWEAHWPGMIVEELAYVLATFKWECVHTMQPVEEGYPSTGAKLRAYQRNLRYYPWFGRGPPQLTWEGNYKKFHVFGDPSTTLDKAPEKMLEWDTGLSVLFEGMVKGMFTGHKLADYISRQRQDYEGARAIINGIDNASEIAEIAIKFLAALRAALAAPEEPEKPKVSNAVKTGGVATGGGLIAAGAANAQMGGSDTASVASIIAGLATVIAPWVIEHFKKPSQIEAAPSPKPAPPEDAVIEPTEITVSQAPALEAAIIDFKRARNILAEEIRKAHAKAESFRAVLAAAEAEIADVRAIPAPQAQQSDKPPSAQILSPPLVEEAKSDA